MPFYANVNRAIGRWSFSEIDPLRSQNSWPIGDLWSPLQATGCYLWLDFSDNSRATIQSPHYVSLQDKSGNNRTATTIAGLRPIYEYNPVTELNHGRFAGYLIEGSLGSLPLTQEDVYVVLRMENSSGQNARVYTHSDAGLDYNGTGHYIPILRNSTADSLGSYANNANVANVPVSNGEVLIFNARHSGSSITNIKNGQISATAAHALNRTFTRYRLGCHFDNNSATFQGWIGEVIAYSRLLTEPEQNNVLGYLAWKWNLTSLLANNHPYKLVWPRV